MYWWPNNPLKLVEPGLLAAGTLSAAAPFAPSHLASPTPQWIASPMKASWSVAYFGSRGGVVPKTVGMSPPFSSTMLAVENAPTEQPALLKATHGSGAVCVGAVFFAGTVGEYTIDGAGSLVDGAPALMTGDFQ